MSLIVAFVFQSRDQSVPPGKSTSTLEIRRKSSLFDEQTSAAGEPVRPEGGTQGKDTFAKLPNAAGHFTVNGKCFASEKEFFKFIRTFLILTLLLFS